MSGQEEGALEECGMISTYPALVPTFVLAQEIQAPLRRLALRRQHLQRVENTAVLQAAIRRAHHRRQQGEEKENGKEEEL